MFAQLKQKKKLQEQKQRSNQQYLSPSLSPTTIKPIYRQVSPLTRQHMNSNINPNQYPNPNSTTTTNLNTNMKDSATILSGTTSRTKLHNQVIIPPPRLSNIKRKESENTSPIINYQNQTYLKSTHQQYQPYQQPHKQNPKTNTANKQNIYENRSKSPSLRMGNIELNLTVKPISKNSSKTYQCDESVAVLTRKPTICNEDFSEIEEWKLKQKNSFITGSYLHQHPTISYKARAILLDWMMELSSFYHLHRETYYLAVNIVDSYLSVISNMPLSYLQLLGAASLFICTKHQEYQPQTPQELSNATNGAFTEDDILKMEVMILKGIKFNIRTLTYPFWLNYFIDKWIGFEAAGLKNQSLKDRKMLERIMYSIIDISQLDVQSLNHKPRETAAGLLLLLLCLLSESIDIEEIQYSLPYSSKYLLESFNNVVVQFKRFLSSCMDMRIMDLAESVQFISSYFFVCESIDMEEEFSGSMQGFKRGNLKMVELRQKLAGEFEGM